MAWWFFITGKDTHDPFAPAPFGLRALASRSRAAPAAHLRPHAGRRCLCRNRRRGGRFTRAVDANHPRGGDPRPPGRPAGSRPDAGRPPDAGLAPRRRGGRGGRLEGHPAHVADHGPARPLFRPRRVFQLASALDVHDLASPKILKEGDNAWARPRRSLSRDSVFGRTRVAWRY